MTDAFPTDFDTAPPDELTRERAAAWQVLAAGAATRRHPFRTFTLATVAADGTPDARTMVLRGADETAGTIRFHSDVRSPKIAVLRNTTAACAVFYGAAEKYQVRLWGTVTICSNGAVSDAVWEAMPAMSRETYRAPHAPGLRITGDRGLEPLPQGAARVNFAVCHLHIAALEWLSLASTGHRRARYERTATGLWVGRYLAP